MISISLSKHISKHPTIVNIQSVKRLPETKGDDKAPQNPLKKYQLALK